MRKVLFLTEEFPPFKGGVGRFMKQLADAVPGSKKVIVAQKTGVGYPHSVTPISFRSQWMWPSWLPACFSAYRLYKKNNCGQIVVSSVLPSGACALLLHIFFRIPYSVMVNGMDILHVRRSLSKKWLVRKILEAADSIFTCSDYTKEKLSLYGIHQEKTVTIHPKAYCTQDKIPASQDRIPEQLQNSRIVLSVGRLVKRKNLKTVIDVAKEFKDDKKVQFVIIGDGPEKNNLERQIEINNLQSTVRIRTNVHDDELAAYYQQSRAMLFLPVSNETTGDVEGFGIVAVEAASFGLPCIASNQGGVPDAVQDGVSGFLVNPQDTADIVKKLHRFIYDEELWAHFHKRAKQSYHIRTSNEQQKKIFAAILGDMGSSSISVVIPAYNAQKTITACLHALFRQTVPPKEIIVVDDGSQDQTRALVSRFSPAVTLITQKNSGAPHARNVGLSKAKGEYILFLDSDIRANPRMLERMQRALLFHPEASYAYSRFRFGWKKFPSFPFDPQRLRKHNYIHTSSLIRMKDAVLFDETLKRHQDWDLWLTMLKHDKRGVQIQEYLYEIRTQKNRISSWLPSFAYRLPFAKKLSRIKAYEQSSEVIRQKHGLR